ncbi:hypothetical protein ACMAUO_19465 [Gluconacetobacter sp. Hr-1-5]|uniref:hypothetical protein n=1 Tax=Gluconacetobacter sp. Hr-1-5 TaxID=3395370 RepID=UPI003B520F64
MNDIRDRFQQARTVRGGPTGSPLQSGLIVLAAACLVLGSVAMGSASAQESSAAPSTPSSPSALKPPSTGGYLQKDKKVPPSEKLSDWPQLKRDQVSPTPRAPCAGKTDCKMVPMSHEEATKRLGHAPPTGDTPR